MSEPSRLAELIRAYCARVRPAILAQHSKSSVSSSLGIWLLLAAAAPAIGDEGQRVELEEVLGCLSGEAAELLADFLAHQPKAVSGALAVWTRKLAHTKAFEAWSADLPKTVESGAMPTQSSADAWADQHTKGMIKQFPLLITPETVFLLASALATDVRWQTQFDLAPADSLGFSPWADRVAHVLTDPREGTGHTNAIVQTESAGLVAAHAALATEGLKVITLIGDPSLERGAVLAAAHEVAELFRSPGQATSAKQVSLFDLPLGPGYAWEISERVIRTSAGPGKRFEKLISYAPAWRIDGTPIDLLDESFGATAAINGLFTLLPAPTPEVKYEAAAAQKAFAQYGKAGFRAAAVTAFAGAMRITGIPKSYEARERTAILRFNRPFGALALVQDDRESPRWDGLPVFEAWVHDPEEAKDEPAEAQEPQEDLSLGGRRIGWTDTRHRRS